MNQTLKISIARGGCRFATPLYLGGSYVLTFDGERSNEADCIVFTKPRSSNPSKTDTIDGLAQSVRDTTTNKVTLALNKQVLLDWFKENGECDVNGYVDAQCYVFNASGEVIADSDVTIEYRPVDFAIDTTTFTSWESLRLRIVALEQQATTANSRLDGHDTNVQNLTAADAANLIAAANDATAKANATLVSAKAYADGIMNMVAKMQYIKCDAESTLESQIFHRVFVTVNDQNQHTLAIDETPVSIEGGDPETTRYVYTDTTQTISGAKTFTGATKVPTVATATNDTSAASAAYVVARIAADFSTFLSQAHTYSSQQIFDAIYVGRRLSFDLATNDAAGEGIRKIRVKDGNGTYDFFSENITKTSTSRGVEFQAVNHENGVFDTSKISLYFSVGKSYVGIDADYLMVSGDEDVNGTLKVAGTLDCNGSETHDGTETHNGSESHTGSENHTGAVTMSNVIAPTVNYKTSNLSNTQGINQKFFWDAVNFLAKYIDGSYRIDTINPVLYDTAEWRTQDKQIGYVNWVATSVSARAFYGKTTLVKVDFPNVTSIGENAFFGCTVLNGLSLPECLSVDNTSFKGCTGLTALSATALPKLQSIGVSAFEGCTALANIFLPSVKYVEQDAFKSVSANIGVVNIGTLVPDSALGNPSNLDAIWSQLPVNETTNTSYDTLISLYPNLKSEYTFFDGYLYDRDNLTTFTANKTQILGDYAVSSCQNLSSISIPEVLFIGSHAINQIKYNTSAGANVGNLYIPKCRYIGHAAFSSETNQYWTSPIEKIRADELLYIGAEACYMNHPLKQFYAPKIKKIGHRAFWGCIQLVGSSYTENGVTVGTPDMLTFNECTHVGERAFNGRTSHMGLTKISLNACEHIGNNAFNDCPNLHELYLYSLNGNTLVQAASSTSETDASIANWGMPTTAYSGTTQNHTGVAVHCVNDAGQHIIVGYQGGWKVIGLE